MNNARITPQGASAPRPADEAVCAAFEAAGLGATRSPGTRDGGCPQPQFGEFLADDDAPHAEVLLRESLLGERELRQRHGQCLEVEAYHGRLPKWDHFIADLW